MFKGILTIFMVLVGVGFVLYLIWTAPEPVGTSYERRIEVDHAEKIEWALSNAVHDVESRNFVVTSLSLRRWPLKNSFIITCGGQDRAAVIALEP